MAKLGLLFLLAGLSGCHDSDSKKLEINDLYRFLGDAVLQGLTEDGANPKPIAAILESPEPHFILKCHICDGVRWALVKYVQKSKTPTGSAPGSGFPKALEDGLASSDRKMRLAALQDLADRYVTRGFERSRMTPGEKKQMRELLQEAKKVGMEIKKKGAYKDFGDSCPSCSGATRSGE
jgi:hypothetical protein